MGLLAALFENREILGFPRPRPDPTDAQRATVVRRVPKPRPARGVASGILSGQRADFILRARWPFVAKLPEDGDWAVAEIASGFVTRPPLK